MHENTFGKKLAQFSLEVNRIQTCRSLEKTSLAFWQQRWALRQNSTENNLAATHRSLWLGSCPRPATGLFFLTNCASDGNRLAGQNRCEGQSILADRNNLVLRNKQKDQPDMPAGADSCRSRSDGECDLPA